MENRDRRSIAHDIISKMASTAERHETTVQEWKANVIGLDGKDRGMEYLIGYSANAVEAEYIATRLRTSSTHLHLFAKEGISIMAETSCPSCGKHMYGVDEDKNRFCKFATCTGEERDLFGEVLRLLNTYKTDLTSAIMDDMYRPSSTSMLHNAVELVKASGARRLLKDITAWITTMNKSEDE